MYKRLGRKTKGGAERGQTRQQGAGTPGKGPLRVLMGSWDPVYLVFYKNGLEDARLFAILGFNIVWFVNQPPPGESVELIWPVLIAIYLTPFLTFMGGLRTWGLAAFARARAVTRRHIEAWPWYRCLTSPGFLAVLGLMLALALATMLLGLYQALLTYHFLHGTLVSRLIATILTIFGIL